MSASRDLDSSMKIIRFAFTPLLVPLYSRLYWFSVKVLLPGWVIWKYWNCPCKFFCMWIESALSTPNGGEGYNSYKDLNPNTITSLRLQCIPAASPHLADKTTSKPQPKCCMYKSTPHQPPYCTYI
jgi:hypothetical protein